ncbi:hypothetical protein IKE82_00660 [Candidatus Saccharibacteria bacterium]|nr:hypothetical protein [Candidatus Saccharibacteria bacterium]
MYDNGVMIQDAQFNQPNASVNKNNSRKRTMIIVVAVVITLVVCAVIALVVILNSNRLEPEYSVVEERENTPTLQLYAKLQSDSMTFGELRQFVMDAGINARIMIDETGSGMIQIPDTKDALLFYIDREDGELVSTDEADASFEGHEEYGTGANMADSYSSNDITYDYCYSYDYESENAIGIYYDEEENVYFTYNGVEEFEFPTRQEAVEAYLAPVVITEGVGDNE